MKGAPYFWERVLRIVLTMTFSSAGYVRVSSLLFAISLRLVKKRTLTSKFDTVQVNYCLIVEINFLRKGKSLKRFRIFTFFNKILMFHNSPSCF